MTRLVLCRLPTDCSLNPFAARCRRPYIAPQKKVAARCDSSFISPSPFPLAVRARLPLFLVSQSRHSPASWDCKRTVFLHTTFLQFLGIVPYWASQVSDLGSGLFFSRG